MQKTPQSMKEVMIAVSSDHIQTRLIAMVNRLILTDQK